MTVAASFALTEAPRRRMALAWKFALALIGLVTLVLVINGLINVWLSYEEAKRASVRVQREKAQAAAERIDLFISGIEQQLGWTTRAEWSRIPVEQRRYDFIRLLRQAPAITELIHVDGAGKEQLRLSRLEPDVVGSGADYAADPRFTKAIENKIWFGPVTFRRGSEPYTTIALSHGGRTPGVTIAEVNLKLIWDVVTSIKIGEAGYAFITDANGRLVAHPDMSLVLRETDLSKLPHIAQAIAGGSTAASLIDVTTSTGLDGKTVLAASAPIARLKWFVFVQVPAAEALAPVYVSLAQTAALLGLGLVLASVMGGLLARRMVVPIQKLQEGAERLGTGALDQRIDIKTGDEIETLAGSFNQMAARIQDSYATLEAKVEARTTELAKSLEYQTATAEVLGVISRSPNKLQPVLDAIAATAARLCEADRAIIRLRNGETYPVGADFGFDAEQHANLLRYPPIPSRGTIWGRIVIEGRPVHVEDTAAEPEFERPDAPAKLGIRSAVGVPLVRENSVIGVLTVTRAAQAAFLPRQIQLLETFANQAVIAINNTRLFNETKEALEQQTATSDVLKVISRSTFDLQKVLDVLVETVAKLCEADGATLARQIGDEYVRAGMYGFDEAFVEAARRTRFVAGRGSVSGRALIEARTIQIVDIREDPEYTWTEAKELGRIRTTVGIPLMREQTPIGVISLARFTVRPFTGKQIELLQTFADQAAIAIENARLIGETKEALEKQTATAEVLKVISGSVADIQPVFDVIAERASHLTQADYGWVFLLKDDMIHAASSFGINQPGLEAARKAFPSPLSRTSVTGQAISTGNVVKIADVLAASEIDEKLKQLAMVAGNRSVLSVPMQRGGQVIGAITVQRAKVGDFAQKEIDLLETFADQAVIAIENARLFKETQARTKEVTEALEYQTATSEVLGVISKSPSQVEPVFDAIVATARRLCGAEYALISKRSPDGMYRLASHSGATPEFVEWLQTKPMRVGDGSAVGIVAFDKRTLHLPDALADPRFTDLKRQRQSKARTMLAVPLMSAGEVTGVLFLAHTTVRPFTDRQIELVTTFADQAVIAIENARLFEEVQAKTRDLTTSLDDLRTAQDRLVQTEKLASLGALTAGIAHEIKNPLNFVNNFAALSGELLGELDDALKPAPLNDNIRAEINELTAMLKGNLEKVVQHGKRADSIVKNMLLHSREGSGEHRAVDVNALVEESINLAYHGARAEKPGFNITLDKKLDPEAGEADLFPQEITRVLLNLVTNGFYAATKRGKENGAGSYQPTLSAATRSLGDRVEIRIRDNGTGIPPEVKARMFNPFFTTKPAGEGTGLGLSLSHDIVVKQHGGTIEVDTVPGEFTEFTVTLPRILAKQTVSGNSQ